MIVVQRKPVRLRFVNVWVRKSQTFYNEPTKELKELTWRGFQLKHCKGHIRLDVSFARFRRSGSEKQILSVTKFKTIQIIVINISIKKFNKDAETTYAHMCINSLKGSSYSSEKYQYKIEHIRSRNPDKLNFCLQYIARISKFEWGYSLASITYELFTVIFRENHVAFSVETNFAFGTLKEIHTKSAVLFFANVTQTWNPRIVSIFDT